MSKFIICKPRGGMIDILSLIIMSLKYAVKFNRILIIDTRKSLHFKDGFFKYFNTQNKNIYINNIDDLYNKLYLTKKWINYAHFDPFIHFNKTINLNMKYIDNVLLFGNDNITIKLDKDIIYFFNNFCINKIILDNFQNKLSLLPKDYISVHIRNTDYKSNVDLFIKKNYEIFNNNEIFLATDDINSIKKFKNKFKNIYSFAKFTESTKKYYNRTNGGIHFIIRNNIEHENFNIDTFTDFLLLANSKEFFFSCNISGFSYCANLLFNEKNIIKSFSNIII